MRDLKKKAIGDKKYFLSDKGKATIKRYRQSDKGKTASGNAQRKHYLMAIYGLTLEQKQQMFVAQKGLCLICDMEFKNVNSACVDHNHKTSKVRGLLCKICNGFLGKIKDDFTRALKVAKYLQEYDNII